MSSFIIFGNHKRSSQSFAWKERYDHWRNERNCKQLQMVERIFEMLWSCGSFYRESANDHNWNSTRRTLPRKFASDVIQKMPTEMEEGQKSERKDLDLLFQRESSSIKALAEEDGSSPCSMSPLTCKRHLKQEQAPDALTPCGEQS